MFHTSFTVSTADFEQVNVSWATRGPLFVKKRDPSRLFHKEFHQNFQIKFIFRADLGGWARDGTCLKQMPRPNKEKLESEMIHVFHFVQVWCSFNIHDVDNLNERKYNMSSSFY